MIILKWKKMYSPPSYAQTLHTRRDHEQNSEKNYCNMGIFECQVYNPPHHLTQPHHEYQTKFNKLIHITVIDQKFHKKLMTNNFHWQKIPQKVQNIHPYMWIVTPSRPFKKLANLLNWCSIEEYYPPSASYYRWLSDQGPSSRTVVTLRLTKPQSQSCAGFT